MLPQKSKRYGFKIHFPKNWTVVENPAGDMVALAASPVKDGAKGCALVSVAVYNFEDKTDAELFEIRRLSELRTRMQNFELLDSKRNQLIDGADAWQLLCRHDSVRSNARDRAKYFIFTNAKHGWLIMGSAQNGDFDKYAGDIDAIVKSFKLVETN